MISPRAPVIGLPTFRLSSWASSSVCVLDQGGELGERPAALAGRPGRPALAVVERRLGRLDGAIHVGRAAERRGRDDLAGGRVDDVERLAVGGIDGLAADDHPGRQSWSSDEAVGVVIGWPPGDRSVGAGVGPR